MPPKLHALLKMPLEKPTAQVRCRGYLLAREAGGRPFLYAGYDDIIRVGQLEGAGMSVLSEVDAARMGGFCQKWKIAELALFGSVLRPDFGPTSDVDVLVTFAPDSHPSLFDMVHMEEELKEIFAHEVDLVSRRGIENSRNYIRRKAILDSARVLYAA